MFNTLGSFSAVYFALAAVLFILILFEKHFVQLEENLKAKKRAKNRKSAKENAVTRNNGKNNVNNTRKNSSFRRIPDNAA